MRKTVTIRVFGVVQGVGFRPFVYQLATGYGLTGWVCNTSGNVSIEVEGEEQAVKKFLFDLEKKAPPIAHIEEVTVENCPSQEYSNFEIRQSIVKEAEYQLVSPDIATCSDCLGELFSPSDRRYHYPFTNCTNCGPRFTIIEDIPYDRAKTTMKQFVMCPQCQSEYDDPLNRRFHAQPNACPECGPQVELITAQGSTLSSDNPIVAAGRLLKDGHILAIKGLGGFQLACDATNEEAVQVLRERKRRPAKPFAIMVASIVETKILCHVSEEEERVLTSARSPIVLLRAKQGASIACAIAPGLKYIGVMLPYTPLHYLLLKEVGLPLVMTSGNLSEEPIAKDNDEAMKRLGTIADYFLLHNRDIYSRYDDSVCIVENTTQQMVRRARGYAPFPIRLPFTVSPVLGCGAEIKNTFCMSRDNYAFLGQHIGDMENLETLDHYEKTIELYKKLFRLEPEIVACDLHPDYLATKYAHNVTRSNNLALVSVQHHHAHIASCMIENNVQEPVIGVAFDGTGYGSDGCIWGGEFMVTDLTRFERSGHLEYVPLPGGDAAAKKPYRMAIGYLYTLLGENALNENIQFLNDVAAIEVETIKRQIDKGINTPLTSSCGRLFDAVAALINIRGIINYEAQAAIELEMAAPDKFNFTGSYPFSIVEQSGVKIIHLADLFASLLRDIQLGTSIGLISAKFHKTIALIIVSVCKKIAAETGITRVALSGGVFQNRLLFKIATALLSEAGFTVLTHSEVPCNDGGISLGQAVIAHFVSRAS